MQRALVVAVALALNAGALAAATPGAVSSAVAVSADGSTALLMAAYEGDAGRVAALLKQGANPRQGNRYGATPLGEAARRGDADIMRLLLNAGANANEANAEGQTALMEVARTGNLAAAMMLLKHGAKIDAREHWGGQTALIWATAQNQPAMIKLLVAKGADVNARATVRDWQRRVTAEGRPKDMNRGGMTPLLYAARDGYLDCVSVLLRAKAQVDLTDPDGTTPLVLALMNGHWDVGKALIEAGADVNQWDFYGQSPLYMAVDMKTLPAGARVELPATDALSGIDMIKLLLAKGANPNMQLKLRPPYRQAVFDRNADFALVAGSTPLLRAAVAADTETMQLLLVAGAKVDLPNEEGVTPFMATVSASGTRGKLKTEEQANEALTLLQSAGADVNAGGSRGLTAAHSAANRGWNNTLVLLASFKANLDAAEVDKLTPIDYALGRSRVGFLQTKPPVRTDTADVLRKLGATAENANLPPWPGVPTPTLTAKVPE